MHRTVSFSITTSNPNGLADAFGNTRAATFYTTLTETDSIAREAIQAAISAATGQSVHVPCGVAISSRGSPDGTLKFSATLKVADLGNDDITVTGITRPQRELSRAVAPGAFGPLQGDRRSSAPPRRLAA